MGHAKRLQTIRAIRVIRGLNLLKRRKPMRHPSSSQQLLGDIGPKWLQSPVSFYKGNLSEMLSHIPEFERRSLGLTQKNGGHSRLNGRLDMIVRRPTPFDQNYIPIGVVSKGYTLVPHTQVVQVVQEALAGIGLSPKKAQANLEITEYGERMALSVFLPEQYQFDPGDGHPMALRLECHNSVDGTTRFKAFMGWFRFICSNGLIIGVTQFDVRRRHVGEMALSDVGKALAEGLKASGTEKENFTKWRQSKVSFEQVKTWVDSDLRKGWGFKAAARAWNIAKTGFDADISGPYKDNTPTTIPVKEAAYVPGARPQAENLYDMSQILAWLARDRRDLEEQLQ
jgi:hypothetical protein